MNDKHFPEDCVASQEGMPGCEDCYTPAEERDFWREVANGSHNGPEDCPSYYDGCNCGGTLYEEVERLSAYNLKLAKVVVDIWETDALQGWAYEKGDEETSIADDLREVAKEALRIYGHRIQIDKKLKDP